MSPSNLAAQFLELKLSNLAGQFLELQRLRKKVQKLEKQADSPRRGGGKDIVRRDK